MKTVCEINQCTGCHACVNSCGKGAIRILDDLKSYNATISPDLCVDCGICEKICPVNNPEKKTKPIEWHQGWATDENIRSNASSGGIATEIATAFIKSGGVVCSCAFENGEFGFDFAYTCEDVMKFTGSKYVKSNPSNAYKKIKMLLSDGKKVLFIGLPCQVASIKKYTKYNEGLFTVDLICHGTPSPKLLEMFLSEKGYSIDKMSNVKFRKKGQFYLANEDKSIEPKTVKDRYTYAFLGALCYTENCYNCEYASVARVSDISLGDSWGSELDADEQKRGVSLILCQSEKGKELLSMSRLHLCEVDIDNAIKHNGQLNAPSKKPAEREKFYACLSKSGKFGKAVKKCYPKVCFKQDAKAFLIKAHILRR